MTSYHCISCDLLGTPSCDACKEGSNHKPAMYREMINRHKHLQACLFSLDPDGAELPEMDQTEP